MQNKSLILVTLFMVIAYLPATGQRSKPKPAVVPPASPGSTLTERRLEANQIKRKAIQESIWRGATFTNIGPTIMSGRVVDLDVNPDDPTHFYVAYASGGVFVTRNNGQTFTPVFEDQATLTIGDIAVDWKNGETLWVGTGESNSSRSSYAGTGVYKSKDKGKTWEYLGLPESHHIGKIILHPNDPNTAWVAVVGHLYSYNPERGLYKTRDGGRTWRQTLYLNPKSGAIDMEIHPRNPDILYCTMWERERQAWNFKGSGPGSGIYRSADGGESWELMSRPGSGFPTGEHVGRIGLAIYPENPDIIYAFLDNQGFREDVKAPDTSLLQKKELRTMTREAFLQLSTSKVERFLRDNNFPEKYKAEDVIKMVQDDKIQPLALVHYLEDANSQLFDSPIIGAELYRSNDGGRTWTKTHTDYLEGLYYTYGYYFGKMNVSPVDPDVVYLYGVDIVSSRDGGKTFKSILSENVHVDFHGLWINPKRPDHLIVANDGGLNMSYDDGETWSKLNAPAVSQFYFINVDNARPYNVYGGMQDNGTWYGPSNYKFSQAWHSSGQYPYKELGGGDGMQVAIDTINQHVFYGYQFGHYFRKDTRSGKVEYITPRHDLGERPYRWNWQTPVIVSRHNPAIVYIGSNHFHRSMNHGLQFTHRSADLTKGGRKGNVPYGTLTTLDESPLRFGLLYSGSDDGLVHVSMDAGQTWENISAGLPDGMWVSRVVASAHVEGRVFVTLNGYRFDHFTPYVFESQDYGKTWSPISSNLPQEPVNALAEDPVRPDVLYVGTDGGVYISMDRGKSYMPFGDQMPPVAVHDLKIQKREGDLLVGTHGRSIYKLNLNDIQKLTPEKMAMPLYVLPLAKIRHNPNWGRKRQVWSEAQEPECRIPVWSDAIQIANVEVYFGELTLKTLSPANLEKGLQYIAYNLQLDSARVEAYQTLINEKREKDKITLKPGENGGYYLLPGKYRIRVTTGAGQESSADLEIEEPRGGYRFGVRPSPREERKIKEFIWED